MSFANTAKFAVVGGGLAGLTAAYELSKQGAQVKLFEKDHAPGGRAKTISKDGSDLNLGPHALYKSGSAYRFLSENNLAPEGSPPKINKPFAIYKGDKYSLPLSTFSLLMTRYLTVIEKLELGSFFSKLAKLNTPALMSMSLTDWFDQSIQNERVRQTIAGVIRLSTYSDNPAELSAGAAFEQVILTQKGVLYLDHGWNTIIGSLLKAIEGQVTFEFGSTVKSVRSVTRAGVAQKGSEKNGKNTGVALETDKGIQQFDAVVLALPPEEVNRIVPKNKLNSELSKLQPSRVACFDVCLKRLPAASNTFAIGIDEPLYYSVHSAAAKLAPAGGALIQLSVYLNTQNQSQDHESRLELLMDQLQPGWRSELVHKRYLPHMVASFGLPLARLNGASGLSTPALAANVYVCGDYVGSGAQLADCSVASALQAVELLRSEDSAKPRIALVN